MPIIIYIFTLWPEVAAGIVLQGERFKLRTLYKCFRVQVPANLFP